MVDHFVMTTQRRVFILENIEAMWTGRHNFFYTIVIQCLNILVCHHLKQKLVACPSCGIAIAHFFLSKDSVLNAYFFQDRRKCFCNFLSTLIKAARTTHPE